MAVESAQQVEQAPEMPVKRWKFTVDDYYRMGELGIFPPDARVELVDGDVYEMPPSGPEHAGKILRTDFRFTRLVQERAMVRIQSAVHLPDRSEPEPDLALVAPRDDFYESAHPTVDEIFLIVEIAASTLTFDSRQKAAAYAKAGISDYWVVDLVHRQVIVHRDPMDGVYQSVLAFSRQATLTLLAFPDLSIPVSDILG
ncbi:MAG: Uma2 family endonuclease [Chloroflexota bacterium]